MQALAFPVNFGPWGNALVSQGMINVSKTWLVSNLLQSVTQ